MSDPMRPWLSTLDFERIVACTGREKQFLAPTIAGRRMHVITGKTKLSLLLCGGYDDASPFGAVLTDPPWHSESDRLL